MTNSGIFLTIFNAINYFALWSNTLNTYPNEPLLILSTISYRYAICPPILHFKNPLNKIYFHTTHEAVWKIIAIFTIFISVYFLYSRYSYIILFIFFKMVRVVLSNIWGHLQDCKVYAIVSILFITRSFIIFFCIFIGQSLQHRHLHLDWKSLFLFNYFIFICFCSMLVQLIVCVPNLMHNLAINQ